MDLEARLIAKLNYLRNMADKYRELPRKHYWRVHAIEAQIQTLEELQDGEINTWDEAYKEDSAE